ncbi:uncharacterized protein LOC129952246 [Eupeodes corollae]|uniref:uncharacterized protein LOC129952246 n=1 Tax=Eupeodes corollae TaxID=290404 RepID=UPI0024920D92|nr:uncharacterized protein LOC129952246 [Eupeodes corollae]XP_055920719.1 uncharacterized protein LOC129952246 [Eupeodes corollae]
MECHNSNFSLKSEEEDTRLIDTDSDCMFYGSFDQQNDEQKTQDLFDLLKSWNQLELFDHFSNEKIDLEVLSVIKPHHFERLLESFNLRTHIMFEHNLEQWRESIGLPLPSYPETSSRLGPHRLRSYSRSLQYIKPQSQTNSPNYIRPIEDTEPSTNNEPASHVAPVAPVSPVVPEAPLTEAHAGRVSLDSILKTSIKGRMLLELYKTNQKFEETQRTLLIHLIAEYYTEKGIHLELSATHKIEKEIIATFPTEQLEYYRTSKRGRIYNKFCNHKYSLIKVARCSIPKSNSKTATNANAEPEANLNIVPEEDAEKYILLLKNGKLSDEQFETAWKSCAKFRINEIRKYPLLLVLSKWPQYKLPHGYKYIALDFKYLEPKWNSLVNNWDAMSEKLFTFLTTGQTIKTNEIKSVLSNISTINSKDGRDAALMWCLHGYLKPTNIIVSKINDKGKKTLSKISIKDSQDSFVYVGESMHDIEKHRLSLKKQFEKIDPFIAVLGTDIMNFRKIYVCIDDIKYSIDSFKNAVDLCYKIIVLFKLEYPTACKGIWSFFHNMFFEIKPKTNIPRVHILINELREMK